MIFGSCHYLFHQLIQRDKAHIGVSDMDLLPTLAADLVRRSNLECLDQLMHDVGRQPFHIYILLYFLNKLV